MNKICIYITAIGAALTWNGYALAQVVNEPTEAPEQLNLTLSSDASAKWLKLLDEGKYGETWDTASNIFHFTVKKNEWIKAQDKLRKPLGKVVSRKMVEQRPAKNPRGLPVGDYMVIYYKTAFENRPEANELITMVLSTDGQWKVLTYHSS